MFKLKQRSVGNEDWSPYCNSENLNHHLGSKKVISFCSLYRQFQNELKCDKNESEIDYDDICTESEVLSVASTVARVSQPSKLIKSLHQSSFGLSSVSDIYLDSESKLINAIFESARSGNLPLLKQNLQGLEKCWLFNLIDKQCNNLWHVTAKYNHLPCLRWLCFLPDGQEPLLRRNYQNLFPVECAIKTGSLEVVQWLIKNTITNKLVLKIEPGKRTVIHLAAECGQARILGWLAQYLSRNGVDLNHKDSQGNTALHFAAKYNHLSSIKALVLNNANVKIRNKLQLKPIDIAEINGFNECVNYLAALESCISLAEENISLKTELLHYGAEFSELERCFHELLQLTKISSVSVESNVTLKIEAIDQRWKQCKARSLKIQNMVNQSPARVLQAHFAKVFNNSVDLTLVDTSVSNELLDFKTFEYNGGPMSDFNHSGKGLHNKAITYNRSYDSLVDPSLQKDPNFYQLYKSSILNCSSELKLDYISQKVMLKPRLEPMSCSLKQTEANDFWIEAHQDQYSMLKASTPENGFKSNKGKKLGICESLLIEAKGSLENESAHEVGSNQDSDYYVTQINNIRTKDDHFNNLNKNRSKNKNFLLKFSIKKWANSKSKLKTTLSSPSSKSKDSETQEADVYHESSLNECNKLNKSTTSERFDLDQDDLSKQPSSDCSQPSTTSEAEAFDEKEQLQLKSEERSLASNEIEHNFSSLSPISATNEPKLSVLSDGTEVNLIFPSNDEAEKKGSAMVDKKIDNSDDSVNSRIIVESRKLNQVDTGILKSIIYKSRPVKKATIKDLTNVKLNQVQKAIAVSEVNSPNDSDSSIKLTVKQQLNQTNLCEKVPDIKTSRDIPRRKNGNKAWYDVSDDEEGLISENFMTNSTEHKFSN